MLIQIDHLGTMAGFENGRMTIQTADGQPITRYHAMKDRDKEMVFTDYQASVQYHEQVQPLGKQ